MSDLDPNTPTPETCFAAGCDEGPLWLLVVKGEAQAACEEHRAMLPTPGRKKGPEARLYRLIAQKGRVRRFLV